MDWKSIEPLFVTSIIGLVGWSLVEISNLKVSTAKIETELNYVKESIKTIAGDIRQIKIESIGSIDTRNQYVPVSEPPKTNVINTSYE